jgi:hypothetical protein
VNAAANTLKHHIDLTRDLIPSYVFIPGFRTTYDGLSTERVPQDGLRNPLARLAQQQPE